MKRDLKINYGVLDEIIDQLHTYDGALQSMGESLESVSSFVKTNEGQSVEAWNEDVNTSKEDIKKYKEQVSDLLSLFENYVTDTTSHISPVSRGTMMRVSRNNIWANLQQINSGTVGNVSQALLKTYQQPSFISGLFEDPTDTEKDASEHNKRQLDAIKESIQSTQTVLMGKMEDLWDLYNQKVKAFENTDDAYKDLALDLKYKYTTFFERAGEGFVAPVKDFYDIGRGFFVEAFHMVSGVALISWDIGIVAVSSQIPDPIEPAFLKNKNDAIIEDYTNAALQLKEDPMLAVELMAQSMSDTVEEEGVMYVSGSALTYLIPTSLFVKFIKEGSAVKGVGKARVGDGNVGTGAKGIEAGTKISEADKVKLEKWNRAPDEALYLAHKKTYDNKKFFNQETGDIIYPGSKGDINTNGFVKGVSNEKTLPVGEIIDRYGDNGGGQYFSPVGSSYESRALPPFMKDKPYEKYEVIREFKVDSGTVVKWFDEPGGGTQFYTSHKILDEKGNYVDADVDNLILYKYIKRIDKGDLE